MMLIIVFIILGKQDRAFLMSLAQYEFTPEQQIQLGVLLGMELSEAREMIHNAEGTVSATFGILYAWKNNTSNINPSAIFEELCGAYMKLKRTDGAEYIRSGECGHNLPSMFQISLLHHL